VETLAFSPDSALLATGSTDRQVRLWRRADGGLARRLEGHGGPVTSLAFSPGGDLLASVAEDERLLAWQVADGEQLASLRPLSGRVSSLALSPGGERLAVGGSSGALAIYSLDEEGGARPRQGEHQGAVVCLAFADPTTLVTASADRAVRRAALDGAASIMLQTHGAMHVACLAPGGRLLATSDGESTVQLWRLTGPGETPGGAFWRVLRGLRGRPRLIAFGARAEAVAVSADDGAIRLWRVASLEREGADPDLTLSFGGGRARSLAFSPDGALIAAGGDGGAVQVWRAANGVEVGSLPGAGRAATSLAFAPDGRSLAVGDAGGGVQLWRMGSEQRRRPPTTLLAHAGAVDHLAYGPAGRLVSGSADGTVRVWKV
jgi:WD40 repeat protein